MYDHWPIDTKPPDPGGWVNRSIDQNSTFSQHGQFAYQIKKNHEYSNTPHRYQIFPPPLPPPPLWPLGWGQKEKKSFLSNLLMLHIKLNGTTNAATW